MLEKAKTAGGRGLPPKNARTLKARIRNAGTRAELLPLVTNGLADYFGAEACAIFSLEAKDYIEIALTAKKSGKYRQLTLPPGDTNVITRTSERGRALNLPSAGPEDLSGLSFLERYAGNPLLAVPLKVEGSVTAVVVLIKEATAGGFSPEDEIASQAFADDVAAALASIAGREKLSAELDRLKWENKQLRLVIDSAPRLSSAQDVQSPLELLLEEARKGVPFDKGAVYLRDEGAGVVRQLATFGYTLEEAQLAAETFGESLASRALSDRQTVYVADVSAKGGPHMTDEASGGSFLAVPIAAGEKTLGIIALGCDERGAFEAGDISFVKALATYAAAAVENARRLEGQKKRALQLSLINEIGKTALSAPSMRALYEKIAHAVKNKFNYYNVAIYSIDDRRGELFLETIVGGYADHLPVGYRQRRGDGIVGAAAERKRPILINDVAKDGRFLEINPSVMETKSELSVPVITRGKVAAVIDIQSRRVGAFEESDALVMETLADHIGVILENTTLLQEERNRASELALVGEIGKDILAARDISTLLRTTAAAIRKHFKYFNVAVFLVDPENPKVLNATVVEGAYEKTLRTSPRVPFGLGLVGWAAEKGQIAFSNDAFNDPRYAADPIAGEARSEISIPLRIGDRVAGVLDVQENSKDAFTERDVESVKTFADQLAVAIQNVNLLAKEQRATHDAETLLHISHIISQTVDLDKSLEFLVEETNTVMDADASVLLLLDDAGEPRQLKAAAGFPDATEKHLRSADFTLTDYSFYEKVAASNKPVFIADTGAVDERTKDNLFPEFVTAAMAVAPLRKKNQLLGLLFALWNKPRAFVSESDMSLFEGIAFQAAIGVENVLYLENVKSQTDYLSILSSIAADASRLPPVDELLNAALDKIMAFAGLDAGTIHLYDEKQRSFRLTACAGLDEKQKKRWEAVATVGEADSPALLTREIFVKDSAAGEGLFELPPPGEGGPAAYISLPLIAKQQVLGRLTLYSWKTRVFQTEDADLLRTICNQLSVFVENSQLFAQNASRMEELLTLLETSKTLSSSLDTEEIIYNIAQKVKDLIGADECTVFLLDREAGILEPIVSLTAYPEEVMKIRLKLGEGITGHVALTGVGEYVNDAIADQRSMVVPGTPTEERESLLCVPLLSREETIGVMTLGRLGGDIFTDRDLQLLTLFAGQVAGSIENARLFDRVLSSISIAEEHRRKLDATFASIADAIIVTDMGLRVIEVNPAAERMLGRQARDIINRHVRSIIETPALHETFEQASVKLQAQEATEFEFAANPAGQEGKTGYYRVLVNAVTNPTGEKVGYVATFRDVTEAKELAFLKENFIANVSHELRTPLTSIIGSAELIIADKKAFEYPYYQFVGIIDKEARRLRELVDSILDFSLLESRELELKLEPVDLNDLAEETVAKYQQMAERNEIRVELEPAENLPSTYADPNLLASALGNLIKNAIQFNAPGGLVRVSVERRNGNLAVAVADNGPGISEDQLENIFSTFYQVDGSSTRTVGGTGLGLTIAKRATESHGGRVDVSSKAGEGSTFTIIIPLRTEFPVEPSGRR
ncbi:MAG TPA: GAF domain-containing protein [bacterium]|nr:GAF domain-containing protein [bacterium]